MAFAAAVRGKQNGLKQEARDKSRTEALEKSERNERESRRSKQSQGQRQ